MGGQDSQRYPDWHGLGVQEASSNSRSVAFAQFDSRFNYGPRLPVGPSVKVL
jgi:hypothetical protein